MRLTIRVLAEMESSLRGHMDEEMGSRVAKEGWTHPPPSLTILEASPNLRLTDMFRTVTLSLGKIHAVVNGCDIHSVMQTQNASMAYAKTKRISHEDIVTMDRMCIF